MGSKKKMSITILALITAAAAAWLVPAATTAQAGYGCGSKSRPGAEKIMACKHDSTMPCRLPEAIEAIDKAAKAVEAGEKDTALAELAAARKVLVDTQKACCEKSKRTFVNSICPIMSGKIVPEKTTEDLTREYKGKKVAFCCAGCVPIWDKLGDEEKQEKLSSLK